MKEIKIVLRSIKENEAPLLVECCICKVSMPRMSGITDGKNIYCGNCADTGILKFEELQGRKLPEECVDCKVEPGCGISCSDCGHYGARKAFFDKK